MFDPAESRPSENRETSFLDARAQYSLLITALESINDAILVTDGKGRMDLWNNKFLTLWGMPPEVIESGCELSAIEVAVKRLKDPATFLAHVNELYSSSLCAVDVFEFQEGRVIERHSQPRWLDGQVVGRVWTFRDITESRRLAEERDRLLIEEKVARAAAEFSQKRAAFLAEASTLLASSLDFHATLKAVGQLAIPSLADWCIIDLLQKDLTFRRTVVDKDPAPSRAAAELERFVPDLSADVGIAECIRSGKPRVFSAARIRGEALVAEDGREVKLNSVDHARAIQELGVRSWMTIPLNVHGNVLGALTFVSALDSRRYGARELELGNELGWRVALAVDHALLYQQARTAVRSREDLLAVVSHDLKNPLSAIYMNARLIQGLAGAGEFRVETLKKQAQIIQQSAERMNRLIRDLLDQAKIETGHFHVDRRDVDFAALVAETLEMLAPLAAQKSISLACTGCAPGMQAPCDKERIAQVLSNLLGNAIKFTPAGGRIEVRTEFQDGALRVSIRDTGPGINPADVPHIFDRYWQSRQTSRLGTGLGLAIAKGIVEAHGGRIWVDSAPEAGSTFHFTLPLEARASA